MKTLTTFSAIIFTLLTLNTFAQNKFISDGAVANSVTVSDLKFEKNSNGAVITWQTSNESNTSQFELQISYDNKSFETIKIVAAGDITNWKSDYKIKFNKTYIAAEKVYYRVKTVFTDGAEDAVSGSAFETTTGNELSYVSIH